jgi:hypothetical protein
MSSIHWASLVGNSCIFNGVIMKSNEMASTVGHCENCLYDIKEAIETNGSVDQREYLEKALMYLEWLYFELQEDE